MTSPLCSCNENSILLIHQDFLALLFSFRIYYRAVVLLLLIPIVGLGGI
jgi:hypothetical protein